MPLKKKKIALPVLKLCISERSTVYNAASLLSAFKKKINKSNLWAFYYGYILLASFSRMLGIYKPSGEQNLAIINLISCAFSFI